jgi:hypothetical protein
MVSLDRAIRRLAQLLRKAPDCVNVNATNWISIACGSRGFLWLLGGCRPIIGTCLKIIVICTSVIPIAGAIGIGVDFVRFRNSGETDFEMKV